MAVLRGRLMCGVGGGLLFPSVFLINDRIQPAYDPVRDFVSEAAIGRGGWVQIVNFVVTGALMVVFATGLGPVVSRWTGWLVAAFGVGLTLAGVFVSDPRPADSRTWHGIAHDIVTLGVFAALTAACFTAAAAPASASAASASAGSSSARGWARYCRSVGVAVPVLFVVSGAVSDTAGLWQRLCIVAGWTWLAALGRRALSGVAVSSPAGGRTDWKTG